MFGYKLVRKDFYESLIKALYIRARVIEGHRWFSGWKDLDIIWEYVLGKRVSGGISEARQDYAKARGTDEYGGKLDGPEIRAERARVACEEMARANEKLAALGLILRGDKK